MELTTTTSEGEWVLDGFRVVEQLRTNAEVVYGRGSRAFVEAISTGERRPLVPDPVGGLAAPPTWSPDGRTVFTAHGDALVAVNWDDQRITALCAYRPVWFVNASPDGREVAFQAMGEATHDLMLCDVLARSTRLVVPDVWSVTCDWENRTAYAVRQVPRAKRAELWRVPLEGEAAKACDLPSGGKLSLSTDQRMLAIGDTLIPSRVRVFDLVANAIVDEFQGSEAAWSPSSRSLALTRGMFGDEEVVLHDEAGQETVLLRAPGQTERMRSAGWGGIPSWSPDGRFLAVSATAAAFDEAHFQKTLASGLSERDAEFQAWRYTSKRVVFDFEDRVVTLREGYWSDVSWRPGR